ncbi:MAG: SxtJ family membrane protein [Acidobacteriota bacterium]
MSIREEIRLLPTDVPALRKFGLAVGGVFAALGAFLLWRDVSWAVVFVYIGVPLIVLGAVVPKILKPVYLGWMTLAVILGAFMTRLLLTVFFFLIITPVALFFKVIGRDALQRKIDKNASTYWIDKEYPITEVRRYENFF